MKSADLVEHVEGWFTRNLSLPFINGYYLRSPTASWTAKRRGCRQDQKRKMFGTTTLLAFLAASIAIIFTPGPAQAIVLARSLGEGRKAGILTGIGLNVGTLVHTLAAALGLSAILTSSTLAFTIVKILGGRRLSRLFGSPVVRRQKPTARHIQNCRYEFISSVYQSHDHRHSESQGGALLPGVSTTICKSGPRFRILAIPDIGCDSGSAGHGLRNDAGNSSKYAQSEVDTESTLYAMATEIDGRGSGRTGCPVSLDATKLSWGTMIAGHPPHMDILTSPCAAP